MSSIIKVENLSKSYIINHEGQERYTAMRDVIANKAKKIFSFPSSLRGTKQSNQRINKSTTEEFWALKDLNFKINQGSMSNHNKVYENLIDVLQNNASITTNAFDAMKTVEIISKIYCSK